MSGYLAELGGWLSSFQASLDSLGQTDVTTVVLSEFGRRVEENGALGTDHGWGNMMLVMGGSTNGGQVYTDWPGLDEADLDRGDLPATIDYRNVLGDLAVSVLGNAGTSTIVPGHTYNPVGVI